MQPNIADQLIEQIKAKKAPIVVGLDPVIEKIPAVYKEGKSDDYAGAAAAIYEFNVDIIDTVKSIVPVVKPQSAFYEVYGSHGILALEKTIQYAKKNNLIVIDDMKRSDIGNTMKAYANAYLGKVKTISTVSENPYGIDFATITPYFGQESFDDFIKIAIENNKGLFLMVKTSNQGSGFIQDLMDKNGKTAAEIVAEKLDEYSRDTIGDYGYSPIGAVVGATYPEEASRLRKIMPKSLILVPGYGAQGGAADDIVPCFNQDGLGAIVSSSRGIIFAHLNKFSNDCTREEYKSSVRAAATKMQEEIYSVLKESCKDMPY